MTKNNTEMKCMEEIRPAILFINSNKSEHSLEKKIAKIRKKVSLWGIALQYEAVISKGPDRDIDRDEINMLIALLLTGKYELIAVNRITDLTDDLYDLNEFMKDTSEIGIRILELSTMRILSYVDLKQECVKCNHVSHGRIWF